MYAIRLSGWITLAALALPLPGWGQEPPREPRPAKIRVDLYGDPLPDGAVARLGTARFRHVGAVHAVAFSKDGKLLAASSDDQNMVVIWDRATGRKLREIPVASRGLPPTHLRFSPDGKRLYGSFWYGQDATYYVWDVETGADAKDIPRPPAGARALGYSPDAREVILLHKEAEIVRWDIEKGRELGRYFKPEGYLSAVARIGQRVLVPQFDGQSVGMWDVAQKKKLWSVEATREKNYPGLPMAFSADGKLFAIEAPPRVISLYESITGKSVRRLKGDVGKVYYSLSISPDARIVAGSNWDGSLRLWDLESGRERAKIPTIEGWTTHVFFAPDSKTFATGGGNNAHGVLLWETATGKRIEPFPGHSSPIASVSFSPDGQTVATSSWLRGDPVVRLWNPRTGRLLRSFESPKAGGVFAVAFSPDGRTLASCGWFGNNTVRLWDVRTGRERHALAGHEAGCTCVVFAPNGKRLASGDAYYNRMGKYGGRLRIWDAEAGKLVREIRGTPGAIQRVLFTRDGRHVLAAANGVHIYDVDTGKPVGEPLQTGSRIWGLALSGDGRLLATADGNGPVRLWEMATRRQFQLTLPGSNSDDVDLTPDGRILVASSHQAGVFLYHWPSGETVKSLSGGSNFGRRTFFSSDGRRLATTWNAESSALIWNVSRLASRPLPAVAKPAEGDLRRWWTDLGVVAPDVAYQAVWRFAAAPEQAIPFLADALRPVKAPDKVPEPVVVARLIDDLDSPKFKVRETASRELERLGEAVVDSLRKAKKGHLSVEQARRINELLSRLDGPLPGPEQLREQRAVAALEQIGGPAARKVLAGLAAGAAGTRLNREAKAALERLKPTDR